MAANMENDRSRTGADKAEELVLDDRFRLFLGAPLPDLGGVGCFHARDLRGIAGDVVGLRISATAPARAELPGFMVGRHPALLSPVAHGAAGASHWIIAEAPPGPSLVSLKAPWSGNGLLTHVLRPVAQALDHLQTIDLTHRAIRPDNIFVAGGGKSVLLGPAWTAPAGMHQSATFEPPYSALCEPNSRGAGSIADDVYALGVLLLAFWTGQMPLAGLEAREVIQLKLEYGSHAALTGQMRLQMGFDEILKAMLSDDPQSRPTPTMLAHLDGIHVRRGGQRSALRATRPIMIGKEAAWNRRSLALLCAENPAEGLKMLRQGAIEQWLRRSPEDAPVASDLEDLRRDRGNAGRERVDERNAGERTPPGQTPGSYRDDNLCLMRLIAALYPLGPLFWRGVWLWPDGLGSLLAGALVQPPSLDVPAAMELLDSLHGRGGLARWRACRPETDGESLAMPPARLLQRSGTDDSQSAFLRTVYALNPYLACASPAIAGGIVVLTPGFLITALEQSAARDGTKAGTGAMLDAHAIAYLDARLEQPSSSQNVASDDAKTERNLRELGLLARAQLQGVCGLLPHLAASRLAGLEPIFLDWPGLSRREKRLAQLRHHAGRGDLLAMIGCIDDAPARKQDIAARDTAIREAADIASRLAHMNESLPLRLEGGRNTARETASATGLACIMAALLYELLI